MIKLMPLAICIPLLSSCSNSLTTKPVKIEDAVHPTRVTYHTKKAVINLTATFTFNGCSFDTSTEQKYFETEVSAAFDTTADTSRAFSIDAEGLKSFSKDTDFEIKQYPDKTIKSINSGSRDKTAETIVNTIKFASSIALAGSGTLNLNGPTSTQINICTPEGNKVLPIRATIESDKVRLAQKTAALESMLKAHGTITDKNPATTQIKNMQTVVIDLAEKIATDQAQIPTSGNQSGKITITRKLHFATDTIELNSEETKELDKLIDTAYSPAFKEAMKLHIAIVTPKSSPVTNTAPTCLKSEKGCAGIIYKELMPATITICSSLAQSAAACPTSEHILYKKSGLFAGYGRLSLLPFENGPFEDNRIEIDFAADGTLERYKFTDSPELSTASKTAADVANAYNELVTSKSTKLKNEAEDEANKLKYIESARKAGIDSKTLDEYAELDAKVKLLELRKKYDQLIAE